MTPVQWVSGETLWIWRQQAQQQVQELIAGANCQMEFCQELDWLLKAIAPLDTLALRLDTYRQQPHIPLARSLTELSDLWQQRLTERVPVQYLLGWTPWRDFVLRVAPGVLIPRPETELLIDLAVAYIEQQGIDRQAPMQWADLGTGSGAIAIGLARCFPQAIIHAVDCSPIALDIARDNAEAVGVGDRLQFHAGEWLTPLRAVQGQLNGIVSNPPYIPSALVPTLQPEVAQHEPHLALDGGIDGLDAIRQIVNQAPSYLTENGLLLFEMMAGQAPSLPAILHPDSGWCHPKIYADFAGVQRFCAVQCTVQCTGQKSAGYPANSTRDDLE